MTTLRARLDPASFTERVIAQLRPEVTVPAALGELVARGETVLSTRGPVDVAALGKAGAREAAAAAGALEERGVAVRRGPVVTKWGHGAGAEGFELIEAAHPICDESSLQAGQRLREWFGDRSADAQVVFCVSGGGSALAIEPRAPFGYDDVVSAFRAVVDRGAPIGDANLIRREMSALKNGGLLADCRARRVVSLITSDVPRDDLREVASGPTLFADLDVGALRLAASRWLHAELRDRLVGQLDAPERNAWLQRLRAAAESGRETAVRVADWRDAVRAARCALPFDAIESLPHALDEPIDPGVARHVDWLRRCADATPRALVSGGELTVDVRGNGRGGRNSEFVLRTAIALWVDRDARLPEELLDRVVVYSLATDGTDGPTGSAGGFLRRRDMAAAIARGIEPRAFVANSDSLGFLERCGTALVTGPTGTNLMDLHVVAIEAAAREG